MWFFWVFALVPILFGVVCLFFDRRIAWQEVLGSTIVALLMALTFQLLAVFGMTHDIETWSGVITQTTYYGAWIEQYEQSHTETYACGTDSKGNTEYCTRTYYTTEYANHGGNWDVNRDFGAIRDSIYVSQEFHNYVKNNFGGKIDSTYTQRCTYGGNFYSGDQNAYVTQNDTGYIHPVTITKSFENRIKAAPSLFSYPKVPTNITMFAWPSNPDWNTSERVLGTAKTMIDTRNWDILNTILGPSEKVNLIVVGFPTGYSMESAKWQEASWIGGKKNDLVICFAGGSKNTPAEWAYVFGWTEKTIVKVNLQDIFTQNPINNTIIEKVQSEVTSHYLKKDWHKFDYIRVDPPTWSYWVYLVTVLLIQGGLYIWFNLNEFDNEMFDEKVDYRGAEEAFVNKVKRKWNFLITSIKSFFIKPLPVQTTVAQNNWPPPQYRSYDNERTGFSKPRRRR